MNDDLIFVNALGMKMIRVRAAAFDAWTPCFEDIWEERGKYGTWTGTIERPPVPHRVELKGDFCLAEFPVTNRIYRRFVAETGHREPGGHLYDMDRVQQDDVRAWAMPQFSADDRAVCGLSRSDCEAFLAWLSERDGRPYRLPAVHEWEYACRAGTDTLYWWGDRANTRYMNFANSRIGHPTPPGCYPPNPWGFFDMHGNVCEPCSGSDQWLVCIRMGGAWNCPDDCTGADAFRGTRHRDGADCQLMNTGIRIACDVEQGHALATDGSAPTIHAVAGPGPPIPELEIEIGEKIDLGTGWAKPKFFVTEAGTWIVNDRRSEDRGKTWQSCHYIMDNNLQLADGSIMQVDSGKDVTKDPVNGWPWMDPLEGKMAVTVTISRDDWRTVEQFKAPVHIPLGRFFYCGGTGRCVNGLIEFDDGRLLLAMYGQMHGDDTPIDCAVYPLAEAGMARKDRTILVSSADGGRSWQYYSTVAANTEIAREGLSEPSFARLANGDLFVALRTGMHGYTDPDGRAHHDEPLVASWSRCDGRMWSLPTRIYKDDTLIVGIYPAAVVTANGVLALMRTRPNGRVFFSPDGLGSVWTEDEAFGAPFERTMAAMQLIEPDTLLVVYMDNPQGGAGAISGLPIMVRKV